MSHTYEVEIKSLLGKEEEAKKLKSKLRGIGDLKEVGKHSQLNHYFTAPDDTTALEKAILPHIKEEKQEKLRKVLEEGKNHSIRTREADGKVLFIVKASIGDDTSANGVSRIEFEERVDMDLATLDEMLLDTGLDYQAKWSRDREEFELGDTNITIDRNAGYGYLAEFEKVVEDESEVPEIENELRKFMDQLGVTELSQDRIERMFAFYNENWEDYYGTDKVFTIE